MTIIRKALGQINPRMSRLRLPRQPVLVGPPATTIYCCPISIIGIITPSSPCFYSPKPFRGSPIYEPNPDAGIYPRRSRPWAREPLKPLPPKATPYTKALKLLRSLENNMAISLQFHQSAEAAKTFNRNAQDEMIMWLARTGYQPKDLEKMRCIHIAGTKGKGSTAAFAAGILQANPEKKGPVGRYTSPHLLSVRERICIDGRPISEQLFAKYFFELWDRLSEASRSAGDKGVDHKGPETKPGFFRFMTLMAFHVFMSEGVRDVVVECGIGGEYDSTNILPKEAVSTSVVTHLGIDHTEFLGTTLEEITWHKAGIFKEGVPAFANALSNDGQKRVLDTRAEFRGAPLTYIPAYSLHAWEELPGSYLNGPVQKNNRVLAVAAAMTHLGLPFDPEMKPNDYPDWVLEGLMNTYIRGRCEIVVMPDGMKFYLDGAHTTESIRETARWFVSNLEENDTPFLIFNQQTRDPGPLIDTLMSEYSSLTTYKLILRRAFFSRNETWPSVDKGDSRHLAWQFAAREVFMKHSPNSKAFTCPHLKQAIDLVYEQAQVRSNRKERPKVLVTGSLYLVGGILRLLRGELDELY